MDIAYTKRALGKRLDLIVHTDRDVLDERPLNVKRQVGAATDNAQASAKKGAAEGRVIVVV